MGKGKHNGYDINLYRSADNNWIGGVCGGIAENINWPVWLVRLAALMLFSVTGMLVVIAYIIAVFMLDKREATLSGPIGGRARQQGGGGHTLKDTVFSYKAEPGSQARELNKRMQQLDQRLQNMESYVTSRKYQFDQELKRS
jgi:phage shock protein C